MKENQEQNDAFVALHTKMKAEGADRETIVQAAIKKFNLGGKSPRHTYRAWLARLADPKKYGGRYSKAMKPHQLQRTQKTNGEAAVEASVQVEVPVEAES